MGPLVLLAWLPPPDDSELGDDSADDPAGDSASRDARVETAMAVLCVFAASLFLILYYLSGMWSAQV